MMCFDGRRGILRNFLPAGGRRTTSTCGPSWLRTCENLGRTSDAETSKLARGLPSKGIQIKEVAIYGPNSPYRFAGTVGAAKRPVCEPVHADAPDGAGRNGRSRSAAETGR